MREPQSSPRSGEDLLAVAEHPIVVAPTRAVLEPHDVPGWRLRRHDRMNWRDAAPRCRRSPRPAAVRRVLSIAATYSDCVGVARTLVDVPTLRYFSSPRSLSHDRDALDDSLPKSAAPTRNPCVEGAGGPIRISSSFSSPSSWMTEGLPPARRDLSEARSLVSSLPPFAIFSRSSDTPS